MGTVNLDLAQPSNGSDSGTWDVPVNGNMGVIDQAFGSNTTIALSNANVTLTTDQSAYFLFTLTGVLTASVQIIFPNTIGGGKKIFNQTTGNFAVSILSGAGDTGGGAQVAPGFPVDIMLTPGRAYYDCYAAMPPGAFLAYGGLTPPPGFLFCVGQAISRTVYSALFSAIGTLWGSGDGSTTFNVPDLRGRLLAGADNMAGMPANRLNGYSVATAGGEQTHTLITGEMPVHNHTDSGHAHTTNDPGHAHGVSYQSQGVTFGSSSPFFQISPPNASITTGTSTTGISIQNGFANIQNTGGGGAHNNVQPTAACNVLIRY